MENHLKYYKRFSIMSVIIYVYIIIASLFLCQAVYADDCLVKTELHSRSLKSLADDFEEFLKYVEVNGCEETLVFKAKATLLAAAMLKAFMNSVSISSSCNGATTKETEKFRQTIEEMPKKYKRIKKCNILKMLADGDCAENVADIKMGLNDVKYDMIHLAKNLREDGCTLTNKFRTIWFATSLVPLFFKEITMDKQCKAILKDETMNIDIWLDKFIEDTADLRGICKGETLP